jgi:hypothetical protein
LQHARPFGAICLGVGELYDFRMIAGDILWRFVTALAVQRHDPTGRVALHEWHGPLSPLKLGPLLRLGIAHTA